MKQYLIRISTQKSEYDMYISGDSTKPFFVGTFYSHNMYSYCTPWHAAARLERLARQWEKYDLVVNREYGTLRDLTQIGNSFNVAATLREYERTVTA